VLDLLLRKLKELRYEAELVRCKLELTPCGPIQIDMFVRPDWIKLVLDELVVQYRDIELETIIGYDNVGIGHKLVDSFNHPLVTYTFVTISDSIRSKPLSRPTQSPPMFDQHIRSDILIPHTPHIDLVRGGLNVQK
jgi:hypothetical protein